MTETRLQKASGQVANAERKTINDIINDMTPQFQMALGDPKKADRFARIMLTLIKSNPKIAECTTVSILGSAMQAVQMALEPTLGQCYLIPYKDHKTGTTLCQFQLGYQGLKALFYRSNKAKHIESGDICENDDLSYSTGTNGHFTFKKKFGNRGALLGFYAYAELTNGGFAYEVMTVDEINAHRDKYSKAAKYGSSPWSTDYHAMASKTVLIKVLKRLPLELDITSQIAQDSTVKSYDPKDDNGSMVEKLDETDYTIEDVTEPEAEGEDLSFLELLDVARGLIFDSELKPAVVAKFESKLKLIEKSGKTEDVKQLIAEIQEAEANKG